MRPRKHLKAVTLCSALMATPAFADEFADRIIDWLAEQGYSEFYVQRTWLGRVKIEAYADGIEREIIVNGRTGEILRDFWELDDDDALEGEWLLLQIPEDLGNDRGIEPVQTNEDEDDEEEDDEDHDEDDHDDDEEDEEDEEDDEDDEEEEDE